MQRSTTDLFCPELKIIALHRKVLKAARDMELVLTNLMTGRPARGLIDRVMREVGSINDIEAEFPMAAWRARAIVCEGTGASLREFGKFSDQSLSQPDLTDHQRWLTESRSLASALLKALSLAATLSCYITTEDLTSGRCLM